MKDRQDPRSIGDINNDGITGHSIGTTSRANWITENMGKTIIIIVGVIVIFFVSLVLTADNGDNKSDSPAERQRQATDS